MITSKTLLGPARPVRYPQPFVGKPHCVSTHRGPEVLGEGIEQRLEAGKHMGKDWNFLQAPFPKNSCKHHWDVGRMSRSWPSHETPLYRLRR